jgi:phage terminase Nu1 subunit (DNA packaging protein)
VADEPHDELRQDELEAMRADVVAHIGALPRSKRRRLSSAFEQTLDRIDARLAALRADEGAVDDDEPDVTV